MVGVVETTMERKKSKDESTTKRSMYVVDNQHSIDGQAVMEEDRRCVPLRTQN
jgi:hypothetical protein